MAQEQAGANVTSTPTVFVNGEQLPREDYTAEGLTEGRGERVLSPLTALTALTACRPPRAR